MYVKLKITDIENVFMNSADIPPGVNIEDLELRLHNVYICYDVKRNALFMRPRRKKEKHWRDDAGRE